MREKGARAYTGLNTSGLGQAHQRSGSTLEHPHGPTVTDGEMGGALQDELTDLTGLH